MIEFFNEDHMIVMARYPDNAFPLAVVDPEYGRGMDGGNVGYKGFNDFEKKDWDKKRPSKEYFTELQRVSKNQIIWGGNYFADLLPASRCYLVWDKGEGFYNRTYAECELAWTSFDKNTVKFKRDPLAKGDYRGKIHPCQKPVALYSWILQNYAEKGQTILDTHGGSFSSAIAAHYFGVDMVICENDEDYFNAGKERFERETRQIAMF